MRTLTISRSSLFLRFFQWVWGVNPEKLNICKLFWGTLLFPVAFLQFKKAYRFIPRSAFFYVVGAVFSAALGLWKIAISYFLLGAGFAVVGYITMQRSRSVAERREEKERVLSRITGRGSVFGEWVFDHTIGLIFDIAYHASYSRAGQHVGGFFAVISEYVRAIKQRLCPLIRVV
ncbi:MAG: hypothetical protein HY435_02715 [Candidatus Liptonbacteria bacterium]|nr:hypothetical protein [Candidatus Liptonbacteria bacterium]